MINKGDKAPDFTLKGIDKNGNDFEFSLSKHMGKTTVLFFYPKDDTPVCTMESRDFSDVAHIEPYADIIGISRDDIESHKKFYKKYDLKVALLSDTDESVHKLYGAINDKGEDGHINRSTFLINKDGEVVRVWNHVQIDGHVEEVIRAIKEDAEKI